MQCHGFENYARFFSSDSGTILRPLGKAAEFDFSLEPECSRRYRLFVTGETAMFYQWKDEPDGQFIYRSIADALDTNHAESSHFCLNLTSREPVDYVRTAYKKLIWPPILSYLAMNPVPDEWTCGISAKAERLKILDGGYLRLRVAVYYRHDGINRRSVENEPDEMHIIDFPEGSYDYTALSIPLHLVCDKIAHVGVFVEGVNYSGRVYLESPFFTASNGMNILPDFEMPIPDKPNFNWIGQNLSRKEWPEFEIKLNGELIFSGEIFERCHRFSEWELELPSELLHLKNKLEIRLISNYHDSLPYRVHELGIICEAGGVLSLISAAEVGTLSNGAYLLVRTNKDRLYVKLEFDSTVTEHFLEKAGLHGIHLDCKHIGVDLPFTLECQNERISGIIPRVIERESDGIITGTGDLVYVKQDARAMEDYLAWYVSSSIGNQLTIRPTYRWSGTRTLNSAAMCELARVLNELGMKYVLMLDGRELPGMSANPDAKQLAGDGYLGRQAHEQDGSAFYWTLRPMPSLMSEQYTDLDQQNWRNDKEHTQMRHAPENYYCIGDTVYRERDPDMPRDYHIAAERSIVALSRIRGDATRHTGPSVMFKYMYEAGYEWLGAETMYTTLEILLSFLRGASYSLGKYDFGVHHALQWSSSPQESFGHIRRYRLALYTSYMQGATQINTEEGLWHLEENYSHFHRFSDCCRAHADQQRDFLRYIETHTRRGKFVSPMGLLHGRYDGWHGFANQMQWGLSGARNTDAERSWDLMKVFYPLGEPGKMLYFHGLSDSAAVGYYSGAPLGNVDTIPIESDGEFLTKYPVLAFMGYHMSGIDDAKLIDYVKSGGKLLLTRAHLATATELDKLEKYELDENFASPLSFTEEKLPAYIENHVNGVVVKVAANIKAPNEILAKTDEGFPLVCKYRIGNGSVTIINVLAYPAHSAIRTLYEAQLESLMRESTSSREVWYESGDDVEVAVYDLDDGSSEIYFLAVDWYREPDRIRTAYLRLGEYKYPIHLRFGTLIKCAALNGTAIISHSENCEIMKLNSASATLQGIGKVKISIAENGEMRELAVEFGVNGTVTIGLNEGL